MAWGGGECVERWPDPAWPTMGLAEDKIKTELIESNENKKNMAGPFLPDRDFEKSHCRNRIGDGGDSS